MIIAWYNYKISSGYSYKWWKISFQWKIFFIFFFLLFYYSVSLKIYGFQAKRSQCVSRGYSDIYIKGILYISKEFNVKIMIMDKKHLINNLYKHFVMRQIYITLHKGFVLQIRYTQLGSFKIFIMWGKAIMWNSISLLIFLCLNLCITFKKWIVNF